MNSQKKHLVVGPSSVGKSTYIRALSKKLKLEVKMAHQLSNESSIEKGVIVHYNLFRHAKNSIDNIDNDFLEDSVLRMLLEQKDDFVVHFLVVKRSTLMKRVILRKNIEPLFNRIFRKKYPSTQILSLLSELDYAAYYNKWLSFFEGHGFSLKLIDTTSSFTELSNIDAAQQVINDPTVEEYSKEEIKLALNKFEFGYQKINLPFGLSTKGQSRKASEEEIFTYDLEGKSVLDVGCAYGYFSFAAEERMAKSIVGTELKDERFIGANVIKEIKGSKVELIKKDIILEEFNRNFDVVFLLNVIHHLKYPMYAMMVLSKLCNELFIIEYPTLGDQKFQSTLANKIEVGDTPLIGVSQMEGTDQTFLFSDEAIRRILMEHNKFFSKIEIKDSPFEKNRRIAFCYK